MENSSYQKLSISIETLRFPLILLIICLHCYTSTSDITRGHETYFRIIYPISLWMGETGVPAFFFISGILFFYSQKTYSQKLKSRIRTLLIPYLFFNGLVLSGYLCLKCLGKPVIIVGKDFENYTLIDFLRAFWDRGEWDNGNGSPLMCPFWYIRNLMILVVLSPVMYYIIRYTKLLFPIIFGFLWVNSYNSAYFFQSLTMFSLGAYFPICNRNPIELFEKYKALFVVAFIFLAIMDHLHLYMTIPFALPFHRSSLIANTFFCILFLGELMYRHSLYSSFLSKSSFFVFCIHYPFVTYLRPLFVRVNNLPDLILVMFYVVSVIFITVLCVILFIILKVYVPHLLNFITGNRG